MLYISNLLHIESAVFKSRLASMWAGAILPGERSRNLKIERREALDSLRQPTIKLADAGDFFPADGV
jgi:hypothetical protein